jgi:hypothetical protein
MTLRFLAASAVLTVVLGCSVAVSFYVVGGSVASGGPYVVSTEWPFIYPLLALFSGGVFFTLALLQRGNSLIVEPLVIAAWLGEYLVLRLGFLPTS